MPNNNLDHTIKQIFARMKKDNPENSTCPGIEKLAAYYENTSTAPETEKIEEHLVYCSKCMESYLSLTEIEKFNHTSDETFVSKTAIKRAKDLIKPSAPRSRWQTILSWFSNIKPFPLIAFSSVALALMIFLIFNLYTPHAPFQAPFSIELNIITKKPSRSTSSAYNLPTNRILTEKPKDLTEHEIKEGELLHAGDQFRIEFALSKEAYVYLFSIDSSNAANLLYLKENIKIKPDKIYIFPESGRWIRVDDQTGEMMFFLIASQNIIEDIDLKIEQLKGPDIKHIHSIFPKAQIQSFSFGYE